jgi:hypothetical protein
VVLLGDSYPGISVGQAAEFWSTRGRQEIRPAQPWNGRGVRG